MPEAASEIIACEPVRIALGLEYHGGAFNGWQRQKDVPSVQADLEAALSKVADQPVTVVAAGRTDTGVHATAQVVSFTPPVNRPLKAWRLGTNSHTTDGVKVLWAQAVDQTFHARFSAVARRYTYVWLMRDQPSPLLRGLVTPSTELDVDAMHRAAQALIGEQDFTSCLSQGELPARCTAGQFCRHGDRGQRVSAAHGA